MCLYNRNWEKFVLNNCLSWMVIHLFIFGFGKRVSVLVFVKKQLYFFPNMGKTNRFCIFILLHNMSVFQFYSCLLITSGILYFFYRLFNIFRWFLIYFFHISSNIYGRFLNTFNWFFDTFHRFFDTQFLFIPIFLLIPSLFYLIHK